MYSDNEIVFKYLLKCNNDEVLKDNITMSELKQAVIHKILEDNHHYEIYYSESENAWRTYLYDGSKKNKRKAIKRNSRENLENFLAEYYIEQLDLGRYDNMTLQQAYEKWLLFRRDYTSAKNKTIKENMYDWNKYYKNTELASMKLKDITPKILIRFFRHLTKNRTYTYKRISNARSVLNGILSWAIEEEIIIHNPLSDVNFKTFSYKPVEEQYNNVFSETDAVTLLTYLQEINNEPYALAIQLFFYLFIRIGEMKAIRWSDIDFTNRRVYLHNQALTDYELNDDLTFSAREVVVSDRMKGYTSKGYRYEHLTDQAIEILEKAKRLNPNGEFVFEPNGKLMLTDTFNEKLKKYCNECGIKYRPSHKIRFYCASIAYDGKNLTTISKLMGHSQVATTLHYLRNVDKGNDSIQAFEHLGLRTQSKSRLACESCAPNSGLL